MRRRRNDGGAWLSMIKKPAESGGILVLDALGWMESQLQASALSGNMSRCIKVSANFVYRAE